MDGFKWGIVVAVIVGYVASVLVLVPLLNKFGISGKVSGFFS